MVLNTNNDERIKSIDSIKTSPYGTNKNLCK